MVFYIRAGRGVGTISLAVSPLMKLERRGKSKRVRRYETQRLVSDFKVSGQPMPSEVRASDQEQGFSFHNFAKHGQRAAILASSCSPRSGASNGILFVRVRST